ncbi:Coiled-coil domain-containing protein 58 [Balamuthia mandrillaris]
MERRDASAVDLPCDDFSEFEEQLNELRKDDDYIMFTMNKVNTGSAEECGKIWSQLLSGLVLFLLSLCSLSFPSSFTPTFAVDTRDDFAFSGYNLRDREISKCVKRNEERVSRLRKELEEDPDDTDLDLELMDAQSVLSNMQAELDVERIVKNRSLTLFKAKCRNYGPAKSYSKAQRTSPDQPLVGPSKRS